MFNAHNRRDASDGIFPSTEGEGKTGTFPFLLGMNNPKPQVLTAAPLRSCLFAITLVLATLPVAAQSGAVAVPPATAPAQPEADGGNGTPPARPVDQLFTLDMQP